MRFTNTSMLDVVVPKQSQWRRHLAVALSLLSLVTLTAAFAQPKDQVDVPRERATVVIVIDASLSMQATDVAPNRLDAAKAAAIEFVEKLPEKYNVSVVSMAGNASILVPPTLAHNTVENAINSIQLQDSTAIGEGIYTALRALQQAPKDPNKPGLGRSGRHRDAQRRLQHRRPRPAAGGGRGAPGQGADLHDRVRDRERLRRPRRQARAGAGRPRADEADRRDQPAAGTSPPPPPTS